MGCKLEAAGNLATTCEQHLAGDRANSEEGRDERERALYFLHHALGAASFLKLTCNPESVSSWNLKATVTIRLWQQHTWLTPRCFHERGIRALSLVSDPTQAEREEDQEPT